MAGRILGFVIRPTAAQFPVVLKNLRDAKSVETYKTQGEDGAVDNVYALRKVRTLTCDGEVAPTVDDEMPDFPVEGEVMEIDGEEFLVTAVENAFVSAQAATGNLTLERSDEATNHPYSEMHPPAAAPETPPETP